MKWYWWLIIVIVPLGFVAYFFYKAGANKDKMVKVRAGKDKPAEQESDIVDPVLTDSVKVNE